MVAVEASIVVQDPQLDPLCSQAHQLRSLTFLLSMVLVLCSRRLLQSASQDQQQTYNSLTPNRQRLCNNNNYIQTCTNNHSNHSNLRIHRSRNHHYIPASNFSNRLVVNLTRLSSVMLHRQLRVFPLQYTPHRSPMHTPRRHSQRCSLLSTPLHVSPSSENCLMA